MIRSVGDGDTARRGQRLHPCDLCGSLEYAFPAVDSDDRLYRCQICRLVQAPDTDRRVATDHRPLPPSLLTPLVRKLTRAIDRTGPYRLLYLGTLADSPIASRLERPEITVVEHRDSVTSMAPEPESFDIIIASERLESLGPASTLFARSRTMLKPLGLFLVGGTNWGSIERRWGARRWLEANPEGTQYVTPSILRDYATRYGFETIARGSTPQLPEIARSLVGNDRPLARLLSFPIGLLGSAPGLGTIAWGLLAKRGLAPTRVIPAESPQEALNPGLATMTAYERSQDTSP